MSRTLLIWMGIALVATGLAQAAGQSLSPVPSHDSSHKTLLDRYCVTCHNPALHTADLVLNTLDVENVSENAAVWEKVVRKLGARAMPPAGMPRPDNAGYDSFTTYLKMELDRAAVADPDPGNTATAHRLNRAEYTNAIRDLLALEIDGAVVLPADDSGGFDNLGDLLSVSPLLMERYLSAARTISRLAIGDPTLRPDVKTYTISPFLLQSDRMSEDLPFGSRGGIAIRHRFPLDGEYVVSIRLLRSDNEGFIVGLAEPHWVDIRLDGGRIKLVTIGGEHVGLAQGAGGGVVPPDFDQAQYERTADADLTVRFPANAGTRLLQVAFLEENKSEEGVFPPRSQANYTEARVGQLYERAWADPALSNLSITGPFNAKGPGDTPSRQNIFVCHPTREADEETCAETILSTLVRRAYRRPVVEGDLDLLLRLYRDGRSEAGSFEAGIQMALEGLLVSTEFLFRIEHDPANAVKDSVYRISDFELASRLSFFLWSSILDFVSLDVTRVLKALGTNDRSKLSEFFDAIRDVEKRVQKAEQQAAVDLPEMERPIGIPPFGEHVKLMFDLQLLAYQTDLTRVITFMMSREFSELVYTNLGHTDPHHPLTHHRGIPQRMKQAGEVNIYHAQLLNYFLEKMQSVREGDGSMLDHSMIVYGAGMGDGDIHSQLNMPIALFGGAMVKGGRHIHSPEGTPFSNLHVAMLNKLGLSTEKFGNSTGELDLDSAV